MAPEQTVEELLIELAKVRAENAYLRNSVIDTVRELEAANRATEEKLKTLSNLACSAVHTEEFSRHVMETPEFRRLSAYFHRGGPTDVSDEEWAAIRAKDLCECNHTRAAHEWDSTCGYAGGEVCRKCPVGDDGHNFRVKAYALPTGEAHKWSNGQEVGDHDVRSSELKKAPQ